jgi:hypothetical protein
LLPNFLIIGGMKCGTTSLYRYLLNHPAVGGYARKEVFYFDLNYERGVGWYRSHFPLASFGKRIVHELGVEPRIGEATAQYLFHPLAPERVFEFDSRIKLIALLRDPIDRAISNYEHERYKRRETLSFRKALEREPERLEGEVERIREDPLYKAYNYVHFGYLMKGRYLEHLQAWLSFFPREQILVLRSEDLFERPAETVDSVVSFLDLPPWRFRAFPVIGGRKYPPLESEIRGFLADYYDEHNRRLYDFLGRDLGWGQPQARPARARA